MLDLIRKKQKTTVVKVVFWVIIATFIGTIFLVWGKGRDQEREMTVAAQVNGAEISFEEFKSTYSNMYNLYRNIYGQSFTPELERQLRLSEQAINMLVEQTLLLQEGERLNLEVNKDDLVQAIAQIPAFQVDGVFNKEQYLSVLNYQRMTPELFEQMQQRQMLVNMTRSQLQASATATDADVADEYRRINEKVNLSYVTFAAADYTDKVTVSDEQLSAYYDGNQETFRVPEQIALKVVTVDAKPFIEQTEVDEAEVERYYNRHLGQYEIAEQAAAAHILIALAADADEAEQKKQRELADKVLELAQKGDFAKLAKKYSADKGTAAKGGELGFFKRGVMDPAFETAAFALEKGALSSVVQSRFGFHIIKGGGIIEAGFTPLADVRAEVEGGLRLELAERLAYEKAMDAYNLNRKQNDFAAAAASLNLVPVETGLFSGGQAVPTVGLNDDLLQRAFASEVGALVAPVKTAQGVVLAVVTEKEASHIPELSKVKSVIETAVRRQQAVVLAEQAAQAALEKLQTGAKLKNVAPKGTSVAETGLFSRSLGDFIPKLGNVPQLAKAAFELTIKEPVPAQLFNSAESFYVVRLKQLQPADPKGLTAEESQRLKETVLTRKQDELLKNKLTELKEAADVSIAPAIVRSIEGK